MEATMGSHVNEQLRLRITKYLIELRRRRETLKSVVRQMFIDERLLTEEKLVALLAQTHAFVGHGARYGFNELVARTRELEEYLIQIRRGEEVYSETTLALRFIALFDECAQVEHSQTRADLPQKELAPTIVHESRQLRDLIPTLRGEY
jgi:hypothetical protein